MNRRKHALSQEISFACLFNACMWLFISLGVGILFGCGAKWMLDSLGYSRFASFALSFGLGTIICGSIIVGFVYANSPSTPLSVPRKTREMALYASYVGLGAAYSSGMKAHQIAITGFTYLIAGYLIAYLILSRALSVRAQHMAVGSKNNDGLECGVFGSSDKIKDESSDHLSL